MYCNLCTTKQNEKNLKQTFERWFLVFFLSFSFCIYIFELKRFFLLKLHFILVAHCQQKRFFYGRKFNKKKFHPKIYIHILTNTHGLSCMTVNRFLHECVIKAKVSNLRCELKPNINSLHYPTIYTIYWRSTDWFVFIHKQFIDFDVLQA